MNHRVTHFYFTHVFITCWSTIEKGKKAKKLKGLKAEKLKSLKAKEIKRLKVPN